MSKVIADSTLKPEPKTKRYRLDWGTGVGGWVPSDESNWKWPLMLTYHLNRLFNLPEFKYRVVDTRPEEP